MRAICSPKTSAASRSHFFRDAAKVVGFGARRVARAASARVVGLRRGAGVRGRGRQTTVAAAARCGREAVHPEAMNNKPGCGVL